MWILLHPSEKRLAIPGNLVTISEHPSQVLSGGFSSYEYWTNPFLFKNNCNCINLWSCRFHSVAVNAKCGPQRVASWSCGSSGFVCTCLTSSNCLVLLKSLWFKQPLRASVLEGSGKDWEHLKHSLGFRLLDFPLVKFSYFFNLIQHGFAVVAAICRLHIFRWKACPSTLYCCATAATTISTPSVLGDNRWRSTRTCISHMRNWFRDFYLPP